MRRTLANDPLPCHLQNRIPSLVMCFKFLTNSGSPRYKIGEKGHTDYTRMGRYGRVSKNFQQDSDLGAARMVCFECKLLLP